MIVSVVQRTLYLMNETKTPLERYQEIHGFDESQARGRPQPRLPQFGNIEESNKDVENILQTWRQTTTQLEGFLQHRKALKAEVAEITQTSTSLTDEQTTNLNTLRQEIKYISVLIHRLQKRVRKMSGLSPQVAYLQACSEFYLLRQQEEVEIRIATEQARAFKLEMRPSVNEHEFSREQSVLHEWKKEAKKTRDEILMQSELRQQSRRDARTMENETQETMLDPELLTSEPPSKEEEMAPTDNEID